MAARRKIEVHAAAPPTRFFSSGCALLDCVLGGGWARRRVINVVGDKSTGKTLLAIEASANYTRETPDGIVDYCEAESAFDPEYAHTLGLPSERLNLIQDIHTIEAFWIHLEGILDGADKAPRFMILDSLDALSDDAEIKREIGDASYGAAKAKVLSEGFRKLITKMNNGNVTLFIISQIRDKINAMPFAKQVQRSGGHALDFYASQVLWLYEEGRIKKTVGGLERPIGVKIKTRLEKSKVGWPWRECSVPVIYGYGMDDVRAACDWLAVAAPDSLGALGTADTGAINKGNYTRHLKKLDRAAVAAVVTEVWETVDKEFRPESQKYTPA